MDNLRERLIEALMSSGTAEVTEDGIERVEMTRAEAEEAADDLIAAGQAEGMLQLMTRSTADSLRARRSVHAALELRRETRQRATEESRRLSMPRNTDEQLRAMKGGQPGKWFEIDNSGPYTYGPDPRDEMQERLDRSRRQRSAW